MKIAPSRGTFKTRVGNVFNVSRAWGGRHASFSLIERKNKVAKNGLAPPLPLGLGASTASGKLSLGTRNVGGATCDRRTAPRLAVRNRFARTSAAWLRPSLRTRFAVVFLVWPDRGERVLCSLISLAPHSPLYKTIKRGSKLGKAYASCQSTQKGWNLSISLFCAI